MQSVSKLGAVISAVLLFIAFPGLNQWYLVFVALIPLFMALEGRSGIRAFGVGYVFGLHFVILILYSIMTITLAGFVMLLIYLSFFYGAFAFVFSLLRDRGIPVWLSAPFTWTAMEIVMSFGYFGFTLLGISHVLYKVPVLIQIASISGMWGVSFIIVLVNSLLFLALRDFGKVRIGSLISAVTVLCILLLIGFILRPDINDGGDFRVAIIQGNIEQDVKWDADYREITLKKFYSLTNLSMAQGKPDMVIWPETSIPFNLGDFPHRLDEIKEFAEKKGIYLLSGVPFAEYRGDERYSYNSAVLISDSGEFMGRYDKMHLVPFSEKVPWRAKIPILEKVMEEAGNFSEGRERIIFRAKDAKFGVLICFESIFPEHSVNYIEKGANLLVVITNDAWFGRTTLPHLHMSASCMRAVETHRWVARCANTGVSAIIAPDGGIIARTDLYKYTYLNDLVRIRSDSTFFSRHRLMPLLFFIIGGILLLTYGLVKDKLPFTREV